MFVLALADPHCTGRYRGQLAHEAMVTGLHHVLFVVADSTDYPILYMALVEFPDAAIDAYKRSLLKWTPLFAWMHDPQVRAPTKVPRELVEAVKSHLSLARALRQHIAKASQPLLPLRTIKGAPLVAYSVTKSGVDGATSWGDLFRSPRIKLSWGQSMVTDVFQLLASVHAAARGQRRTATPATGLDLTRFGTSALADQHLRIARCALPPSCCVKLSGCAPRQSPRRLRVLPFAALLHRVDTTTARRVTRRATRTRTHPRTYPSEGGRKSGNRGRT